MLMRSAFLSCVALLSWAPRDSSFAEGSEVADCPVPKRASAVALSLKLASSSLTGASSGKRVAAASPPEQNLKQRTKKVSNKLVKKALAFSLPLEIRGGTNSKALATADASTVKTTSKVSAPASKAASSAALSAATASATNSNGVEPGDSAVTPWVVG